MATWRRLVAGMCAGAAAAVLPAGAAAANVSTSSSLTVPVGTTVGSTGNAGSLTVVNNNLSLIHI